MATLPEQEAARTYREAPIDSSHGHRRVDTGWNLVSSLEREICGTRFVGSASTAQGYSIAGVRSASFAEKIPSLVFFELLDRPLIHHSRFDSGTRLDPELQYVLVAGTHQTALYHAILGHEISQRSARPVLALQDSVLAGSLGSVDWPTEYIDSMPASSEGISIPEGVDPARIVEESSDGLPHGEGLEVSSVVMQGGENTTEVVVAMGSIAWLLEGLTDASCGLLSIHLLRPFPESNCRRLIKGKKRVFVPYPKGSSIYGELLEVIGKVCSKEKVKVIPVGLPCLDIGCQALVEAINAAAGETLVRERAPSINKAIGLSPGGTWGKSVLLDALSAYSKPINFGPARLTQDPSLAKLFFDRNSQDLGLLVLLRTNEIDPLVPLRRLSRSGVLLLGGTEEASELWKWLGEEGRDFVIQQEVDLRWIPVRVERSEVSRVLTNIIYEHGDVVFDNDYSIEKLDPETLSASLDLSSQAFAVSSSFPILEEPSEEEQTAHSEALAFHFSSGRKTSRSPLLPLAPAALLPLMEEEELLGSYPLLICGEHVSSLRSFLRKRLEEASEQGEDLSILRRRLDSLVEWIERFADPELNFEETVQRAFAQAPNFFDLSTEGLSELLRELEALKPLLLVDGFLVSLDSQAHFYLFDHAVLTQRLDYRRRWKSEIESQLVQLDGLLRSDRELSSEYSSPEAIDSSIGGGGSFIDSAHLSGALPAKRGSIGLSEERKQRIEQARQTLAEFVEELSQLPPYYLIQAEPGERVPRISGSILYHSDPFGLAQGLYSGIQTKAVEAAKASRVASLEIEGQYDGSIHDQRLASFTVDACSEEEILSIPPVAVSAHSELLAGQDFTAFASLLRSGYPVFVLAALPDVVDGQDDGSGVLGGIAADLGYLSIAHREAFVLQSPLSQFQSLDQGFGRMLQRIRPGVAVVGMPQPGENFGSDEISVLSMAARALPAFEYDPDAGDTWADRFSLTAGIQIEKTFCEVEIEYIGSSGEKGRVSEKVTLAHRLALDSRFRPHFRLAAPMQSEDLVGLGDYLEDHKRIPPEGIPFIWVIGENFSLNKALVTREVVLASRSRQSGWRILQELAGLNNEYVLEAIASTRQEVESRVEAEKALALEKARSEGAAEAVDKLVAVLMNPESVTSSPPVERPTPADSPGRTTGVEASESAPSEAEKTPDAVSLPADESLEEEFLEDPYIDTFLCTSCNDCINLNARLFKYNQDNQAFIADPEAGTYVELVKAAEVCPANCIHPGAPREGDTTATDEVVARAKALQ